MRPLRGFSTDQRGATLVEYGLICALVVMTMFVALNTVATNTIRMFNNVSSNVQAVM